MASVDYSPQARRARVFGGLGSLVFLLAVVLSWSAYALAVWRDGQLFAAEALVALALFPLAVVLLMRPYWMVTAAQRPGFLEAAVRLLLLLLLWVGSLWHLLVLAYLALEFALGSGFTGSLVHQ